MMANFAGQNRRSAAKSIWYVLATIAGEPKSPQDLISLTPQNAHYWNGLMAGRVATYGGMVENALGHDISFPQLSPSDHSRIRQALNSRGFSGKSIPHVNSPIDFSSIEFSQFISFNGFVFGGATMFDNANFSGGILTLQSTIFAGNVSFDGATFDADTILFEAEFAGSASFDRTRFSRRVYFSSAKFAKETRFTNTAFHDDVYFNSAKFEGETYFNNAILAQNADFQKAEFTNPTHFQEAEFRTAVPAFFEARLYEYTDWHNTRWPSVPNDADQARRQVQYYQRLALLMKQLDKPDDRHFFFRKELQARRRAESWKISAIMNWLYEVACGYSSDLTRIVLFWFGHIVVGGALLWTAKVLDSLRDGFSASEAHELISELPQALAISLSNAHGLLGLSRSFMKDTVELWSDVPLFNVLGSVQTVLGVILLFFLLLTIRNRFRMR